MSRPRASVTIEEMIAELLGSFVRLAMNDLSILILSNGNAVRQRSDEYPVPKSSSASETPIPLSFSMKRSEERRVGKECRYQCDWSSDVCSSDLILSNGNAVRQRSDEYPVPKSSSASETPIPLSFSMK